jgi:SAM-dependent methyltransferase
VGPLGGRSRRFWRCRRCRLTFLRPEDHPGRAAEEARYRLHCNAPSDAGYRQALDRLAAPLSARLRPGMEGLDYGAGPGPALATLLAERGLRVTNYDPIFAPDPAPLARTWDFVACTETVEHFREPGREFDRLARLIRPGGWIGIQTRLCAEGKDLASWWYAQDPTHLCFYARATFDWIGARQGWSVEQPDGDVILMHRSRAADSETDR